MTEADFFLPRGVSSSEEITIGFLELAAGAREEPHSPVGFQTLLSGAGRPEAQPRQASLSLVTLNPPALRKLLRTK